MDAKQIRFFLEIARTGSFTSAAKKLFISVPGLVKSMDKLEDERSALRAPADGRLPEPCRTRAGTDGPGLSAPDRDDSRGGDQSRLRPRRAGRGLHDVGAAQLFPSEFSFPVCAGSSQNQPVYAQRYDRRMLCARGQRQIGHRAGFRRSERSGAGGCLSPRVDAGCAAFRKASACSKTGALHGGFRALSVGAAQ